MANVITRLTPEQERILPQVREAWLRRSLATGAADRPAIERGIEQIYRSAGLEPPQLRLWLQSPLTGCAGAALLRGIGTPGLRDQLRDQLGGQLWDQLRGQLGDQLGGQLRGQLWDQLGGQLWDQLWGQLGGQLGGQLYQCGYGQHDIPWVAFYEFGRRIGAKYTPRADDGLSALAELSDGGWWWPFRGAVILTERPDRLQRDTEGRLHSDDGPALRYPDGYSLWSVHGVRVSEQIVMRPETLKPTEIRDEPNSEVRRVMLQRFGEGRYLTEIGAKAVHTDDFGTLYRAELGDDEPLVMVKVVNSTPEPDGSYKDYFIRVPPTCRRAKEAVAWTCETPEDEYAPLIET